MVKSVGDDGDFIVSVNGDGDFIFSLSVALDGFGDIYNIFSIPSHDDIYGNEEANAQDDKRWHEPCVEMQHIIEDHFAADKGEEYELGILDVALTAEVLIGVGIGEVGYILPKYT